ALSQRAYVRLMVGVDDRRLAAARHQQHIPPEALPVVEPREQRGLVERDLLDARKSLAARALQRGEENLNRFVTRGALGGVFTRSQRPSDPPGGKLRQSLRGVRIDTPLAF